MNIYDYKNKGYVTTPTTPLRGAYKATYLDEEGLSGPRDQPKAMLSAKVRDGEPDGSVVAPPATPMAPKPAIRGRREMFRIESKMYENTDVDLTASKDLSPAAGVVLNGRDWTGVAVAVGDHHNRSVSTTSNNNNGYHSDPRMYEGYHARNNNGNHIIQDYGDNNARNISVSSTNHDTLDRSVFSMASGHTLAGSDPKRGSVTKRSQQDQNNRSILSVRGNVSMHADQSILSKRSELNDLNKSSVSQYNDINRSVMSGRSILSNRHGLSYRDTVTNERSYHENPDLNRSVASKAYEDSLTHNSLTRDISKVPIHKQNGFASPVRDAQLNQSTRSLNLSRSSLTPPRGLSTHTVQTALLNISFICVLALILVAIALQLLFKLSGRSINVGAIQGSILSNHSYASAAEVAVAVSSVVVMLDLCCLLICVMQAVFAAKLLRCSQGPERAYKYLKECASTRFIGVTGFFISIPFLLLAILLYILMEFRTTAAIISIVVMAVGLVFMLLTVIHSTYYWRDEKDRADGQLPAYAGTSIVGGIAEGTNVNELSTLV